MVIGTLVDLCSLTEANEVNTLGKKLVIPIYHKYLKQYMKELDKIYDATNRSKSPTISITVGNKAVDFLGKPRSCNPNSLIDMKEYYKPTTNPQTMPPTYDMNLCLNEKKFAQMYQQDPKKAMHDVDTAVHDAFKKTILHFRKKFNVK